jgi:putative transposase
MRPKGSQELLTWRRQRAIQLLEAGKAPAEVAEFLGVGRNTVYRWRRRYRRQGQLGIAARSIPGRPPRLRAEQQEILFQCLEQGARLHGFATDHWTQQRVVTLIHRMFGISYCAFHAGRLLAASGWETPRELRHMHRSDATGS